jgi:TPR repeat protein
MTHPVSKRIESFWVSACAAALSVVSLGVSNIAAADDLEDAAAALQRMDYATATALWQPLAQQGSSKAEIGMGKIYDGGFGVAKDPAQATVWFQKAADQGLALMEKAVDHGNANCAAQIGELYRNGLFGAPKNSERAAAWHRRAAEMGDTLAEGRLGIDYQFGIGVQQDSAQAAYWYRKEVEQLRKEAEQGSVSAQLTLGQSYEWASSGLPIDKAAALYWCGKAARQKSPIKGFAEQCVESAK